MSLPTLLLTLALGLTGSLQDASPRAPDGQRGLGAATPQGDLLRVFRTTDDEERAFLAELAGLESELRLVLAGLAESYRSRGLFELLEPRAERSLDGLHAAWRAAEEDLRPALAAGGARARLLAEMALDTRLRVRARLLERVALDGREVRAGLAVLRGAAEGFVLLTDEEAHAIAQRVDLAASRLRARRKDLMALRPRPSASTGPRDDPDVVALLAVARGPDEAKARAGVERTLAEARERAERMWSALFLGRLEAETGQLLEWRERSLAEAARLREEALVYLPDSEAGQEAPPEVAAMRKHERVRWAGFRAREGLASDPLDDVLAFVAAHAADFQWGSMESVPLYDRFLVLRGIRHYDHRTLAGRALDPWEDEALLAVQRPYQPPPRPQPRRGDDDRRGGR